jgi:hypothetical protein
MKVAIFMVAVLVPTVIDNAPTYAQKVTTKDQIAYRGAGCKGTGSPSQVRRALMPPAAPSGTHEARW